MIDKLHLAPHVADWAIKAEGMLNRNVFTGVVGDGEVKVELDNTFRPYFIQELEALDVGGPKTAYFEPHKAEYDGTMRFILEAIR